VVTHTINLALTSRSVPITLSCAPDVVGGCRGTLVLRLLGPTPAPAGGKSPAKPRAVTSRCARGCRPLGKSHFDILAGRSKRVRVRLAHSARHLFGKHKQVSLRATTVIKDKAGHTQVSNTAVTLTRADAGSAGGSQGGPSPSAAKPGTPATPAH
jgi:hypothetical protein